MADVTISNLSLSNIDFNSIIPFSEQDGLIKGTSILGLYNSSYPKIQTWFLPCSADPGSKGLGFIPGYVWSGYYDTQKWYDVQQFTYNGDSGLCTISWFGYISSGYNWLAWRLFNNTTNQACTIFKSQYSSSSTTIPYKNPIHSPTAQFPGTFLCNKNDILTLQITATYPSLATTPSIYIASNTPSGWIPQYFYVANIYIYDGMVPNFYNFITPRP